MPDLLSPRTRMQPFLRRHSPTSVWPVPSEPLHPRPTRAAMSTARTSTNCWPSSHPPALPPIGSSRTAITSTASRRLPATQEPFSNATATTRMDNAPFLLLTGLPCGLYRRMEIKSDSLGDTRTRKLVFGTSAHGITQGALVGL